VGGAVAAERQERAGINEQRLERFGVAIGIGMAKSPLWQRCRKDASAHKVGIPGFGQHATGSSDFLPAEGALGLGQSAIGSSGLLPAEAA